MDTENQHIDPVGLLPRVFSGEATSDEIRAVNDWLAENRANISEYEAIRRLWNITTPISEKDIDLDREWMKMESAIVPSRKLSGTFIRVLQVAASILLISALAYTGIRIGSTESVKSSSMQIAEFSLPDGTGVFLNAGSKITWKKGFGSSHRNLVLKGEGYFDVEKSRTPFTITAGEVKIRVTGTQFNVSAYTSETVVRLTVTEGTVYFYPASQPHAQTLVNAGETGIYNSSTKTVKKDQAIDPNAMAWKTRILDFNNTPLGEVTDILSNTYHMPFSVDTLVQGCTVTVKFERQDVDSVLNVLKSTLDLKITRKGRRILITGEGC